MRRMIVGVCVATALGMCAQAWLGAQGGSVAVELTGGMPGSAIELALNGGKVASPTADAQGQATSVLDLANLGKVEVRVFVDKCRDGRTTVQMVTEDQTATAIEKDCDRKLVGAFWAHRTRRVVIDVAAGTIQVQGQGGLSTGAKIGLGAGGAAAAIGAIAAGGGSSGNSTSNATTPSTSNPAPTSPSPGGSGSTFTPSGTYQATSSVKSDPAGHAQYIKLANGLTLTITLNGSLMTVMAQSGSNFVPVSGQYANGQAVLTGTGTVAGRSNVTVRMTVTITDTGALTAELTMGANGELPTGQPAVYQLTGQKQ